MKAFGGGKKGDAKATFKALKKHSTMKRESLHAYCLKTLGMSVNLRDAVALPDGEDANEWLAMNTVDFFNQLSLLYGMVGEAALKKYTAKGEGFPPGFEYRWADGVEVTDPIRCNSPQYVDYVLSWVEKQMNNEELFPTQEGVKFPKNFHGAVIGTIFKRLFRVFAIIYHSSFDTVESLGGEAHLNTSFKHFMFFCWEWNLLQDPKQLKVMETHCNELFKAYQGHSGGSSS